MPIFIIFVSFLLFWSWTKPAWEALKKPKKEKEVLQNLINEIEEIKVPYDELLSEYNSLSSQDIERLKKVLPREKEIAKEILLVELENIALNNGLLLKNFGVIIEKIEGKSQFAKIGMEKGRIALDLGISGSYNGFRSFVRDLEKSLRIINIGVVSFNAAKEDSYSFNIKAETYFQK